MGTMGCVAGQQLEAETLHLRAEIARVRVHPLAQLRCRLEQIEDLERAGRDRRRDAVREQIRPRALPQPRRRFPCARTTKPPLAPPSALPSVLGDDVDPVHHAAQLVRAPAARADEPGRVRVVDHHERRVALGQIADVLELARWSRPWRTRRRSR